MYEDLDLEEETLGLDNIQGGNRIGTMRNPDFNKIVSG